MDQKKSVIAAKAALALAFLAIPAKSFAFVPLICDLCTVGVVAGLAISRYLGVDDSVVGVWIGAVVVALIVMTNAYLEKKNVRFKFRDTVIALSYVGFTGASLYLAGVVGLPRNVFKLPQAVAGFVPPIVGDKIIVSSVVGGIMLVVGSKAYQNMKAANGGKAHFPFEKVFVPLATLALTSAMFYFVTLK